MAEVEILAEAGVDLVEDLVVVGAVCRDHMGRDHREAGRDLPGVEVVYLCAPDESDTTPAEVVRRDGGRW
jgi:hypothetical protein